MSENLNLYTKTLAGIYAQQGYFRKSAEIYRHLVAREPQREDLQAALKMVEKKLAENSATAFDDLLPLFEQWFDLARQYNHIQKLKRFVRC